ncbi:hypothetical protein [Gallibacterium anatis]|uniref:hypothetical protein n=1 Tax=Gallibacterium anatis TaxID=750 RepID=UPI000BA08553|nr:hypothetical protein [Gallibacterium anatis]WAX71344.1 hypothetical protein CF557_11300 [Gallibacterium anatis]
MSKNDIILRNPKQGALVKATQQSQTFLTLLQQSDERRLVEILKSIDFEDTTRLISRLEHIEWTAEFIEKYAEYWDWRKLSWNKDLPWSMELIERFEDSWNFLWLSWNKALPWSIALIERFETRWDWFWLSQNQALPWSIDLLEKFKHKWDWSWCLARCLDRNEKVRQIFTALSVQGIEEVMDYHIKNENL